MIIKELSHAATLEFLSRCHLARLACFGPHHPYVTPMYFAYHANCIYGFSTMGRKIKWMRANPNVCFEVDEIRNAEEWTTVIVMGRYEELTDAPATADGRALAYNLLQRRPEWWEPGYAKTVLEGQERPLVPIYFRIQIESITGHQATTK